MNADGKALGPTTWHDELDNHEVDEAALGHTDPRPVSEILERLDRTDQTDRVRMQSRHVFELLAEAEGLSTGSHRRTSKFTRSAPSRPS